MAGFCLCSRFARIDENADLPLYTTMLAADLDVCDDLLESLRVMGNHTHAQKGKRRFHYGRREGGLAF